ncbi:hypothetical protein NQ318_004778 [Aromia moschata]|uniref:Uncharacterized protein n=1 Tax=Aromia moschata TaxID=1265417 RepID=A0AAV8XRT9_9CUCU|nr:hypothetical protein NQ318_004778 [Aromia moschata]
MHPYKLVPTNELVEDEFTFTLHGHVNRQNSCYWSRENPHWMRELHTQNPEKVNVWAGIIGENIIGPFFIDGNLNGETYLALLQNNNFNFIFLQIMLTSFIPRFPLHGVRLPRAGLPVGEHAYVVTVQCRLDELRQILEHLVLRAVGIEHPVEREFRLQVVGLAADGAHALPALPNLKGLLVDVVDEALEALFLLRANGGPHPAEHPDVALEVLHGVVQSPPEDLAATHIPRILAENKFKAFKPKIIHTLEVGDDARRLDFCLEIGTRLTVDMHFHKSIMFFR